MAAYVRFALNVHAAVLLNTVASITPPAATSGCPNTTPRPVRSRKVRFSEAVDVVHCHDWHTALIPYYLAQRVVSAPNLEDATSILTIHNLHHQGVFGSEMIEMLELDRGRFVPDGFEFFGKLNVFKAGLVSADRVTTVSPTYAREILEPEKTTVEIEQASDPLDTEFDLTFGDLPDLN